MNTLPALSTRMIRVAPEVSTTVTLTGKVTTPQLLSDAPRELNMTPPTGLPEPSVTDWIVTPVYSVTRSNQSRITHGAPSAHTVAVVAPAAGQPFGGAAQIPEGSLSTRQTLGAPPTTGA